MRVVVLNLLPSVLLRFSWLRVAEVPLALGVSVVGDGAKIASILRSNLVHGVHVVAVDTVVSVLNLMLNHYPPLRLPLRDDGVGV